MTEQVTGAVILCDQIYEDRGKVSILGATWSGISPGKRHVNVAAVVTVPKPTEPDEVNVELSIFPAESPDNPLGGAKLQAEVALSEEPGDFHPPFQQIVIPVSWEVELTPETEYIVSMSSEGRRLAITGFRAVSG